MQILIGILLLSLGKVIWEQSLKEEEPRVEGWVY
jgi:hypothetical protein